MKRTHPVAQLITSLLTVLLITLYAAAGFAQEDAQDREQINQAVFNRVEYHFNLRETDSIYALASPSFKQTLSATAFREFFDQKLYPLGAVKSAEKISFENNIGTYKLAFQSTPLQVQLAIDSLSQIETLLFQPYKAPVAEKKEEVASSNNRETAMDRFIDSVALAYARKGNTHALAVGVLSNGKLSRYYYGDTDRGKKRLPTDSTLFEIGSVTKTFTATLLAYLAGKKQVNLDDSITKYLPDTLKNNPDLQKITLQQLANHTSGLPRMPANFEQIAAATPSDPYRNYQLQHLYSYLKNYQAEVPPDSLYNYSNLGYGLLGTILSQVYGKPFNAMVQEVICIPLGLKNTTAAPDTSKQFVARVYTKNGEETPIWDFGTMAAVGSLKSTLPDLMKYAGAQLKLPETDLENAMAITRQFTFQVSIDGDIGLGWHTLMNNGYLVNWHNGGTGGSSSYVAFSIDKKLAVIVLSNTAEPVDETALGILTRLLAE